MATERFRVVLPRTGAFMKNTEKVQPPKPLTCTINKDGVKHTTWNVDEVRHYLENTTDTVFYITTKTGKKVPMLVEHLRHSLAPQRDVHPPSHLAHHPASSKT